MKPTILSLSATSLMILASSLCGGCFSRKERTSETAKDSLKDNLEKIITGKPGQIGIAIITADGDTITVNNTSDYPLMSMFKLHEAIAVCHALDKKLTGLDSIITIRRATLDPDTWSPMLQDRQEATFSISVGELLRYTLIASDNNTSNLLFDRIIPVTATDSLIRNITPGDFQIVWKEADMKADHSKIYDNRTSPLDFTILVDKIFRDSIVSKEKQDFIIQAMYDCNTGMNRIAAGLKNGKASFAHRTGSGYINDNGEVTAVNDGGYVCLPSGKCYSISVFIKDYAGPQENAEKAIAEISETVYRYFSNDR